ncbi:hypothetical protein FQZ97_994840 [compost metagenome]
MLALEGFEARDQPHRGERGPGGDGHALAPDVLADLPHGRINALQRHPAGAQQLRARAGELDGARMAQEEGSAHLVFERLDLPAHRALCEGEFLGGGAEVQVPGDGVKSAQVPGGDGAGAGMAGRKRHGTGPIY